MGFGELEANALFRSPKQMIIHTVLVVDHDLTVCRIVDRMLSDEHFKVRTSQSVADALGAIERSPFDVYVMDSTVPGESGLDVADRIRSKSSVAPIILISGYDPSASPQISTEPVLQPAAAVFGQGSI
jgi:DNA-binding NtrC family response regulator